MICGDEVMVTDPGSWESGFVGTIWYADPSQEVVHVRNALTGEIGTYPRDWCLVRFIPRPPIHRQPVAALAEY